MTTITIELPLPSSGLSPNARLHFMAKSRLTKQYRATAGMLALAASNSKRPMWKRATVQCRFYWRDKRQRDADNSISSMKAAFDGLADAGLVSNDRGLTHLPPEMLVDRANPRVVVEIWETKLERSSL